MTAIELPGAETVVRLPEPDVPSSDAAWDEPAELSDADFGRLFTLGAAFGTPVLYLILAAVVWIAAPGHPFLFVAAVWPAVVAGWYFGGIATLTVYELRHERAHRQQHAVPVRVSAAPFVPARPHARIR